MVLSIHMYVGTSVCTPYQNPLSKEEVEIELTSSMFVHQSYPSPWAPYAMMRRNTAHIPNFPTTTLYYSNKALLKLSFLVSSRINPNAVPWAPPTDKTNWDVCHLVLIDPQGHPPPFSFSSLSHTCPYHFDQSGLWVSGNTLSR